MALILRWRVHSYVYTTDVEKMFRQIRVNPTDADYQRIIWPSDPKDELASFRLLTLTYGTACAPFVANRVLKQFAVDEGENFSFAVSVLNNYMYVDDVMFGADDIVFAKQIRNQATKLPKADGFHLRKWASNHVSLLDDISAKNHGLATNTLLKSDDNLKVLGIAWNPTKDFFRFHIETEKLDEFTKRSYLSMTSRMFDPLGWASPFTIIAKILLQVLWIRKIGWDEKLPDDLARLCIAYHEQLPLLKKISIPR